MVATVHDLDLHFIKPIQAASVELVITKFIDQTNKKYKSTAENVFAGFLKHKRYYDPKLQAEPLKVSEFTVLLNHAYNNQSNKSKFLSFHWIGPYKITIVLSAHNYIGCRFGTHRTQYVHRMRRGKFEPQDKIPDVTTDDTQHYPDPHATEDFQISDTQVLTRLYGPIHHLGEPQQISASEHEDGNQLITDTDDGNTEVSLPEARQTNQRRQPQHTVIAVIRPNPTLEVTPPLGSTATSSHTAPIQISDINDAPHQTTRNTLPPSPNNDSTNADYNNTSSSIVPLKQSPQITASDSNLKAEPSLRSHKSCYQKRDNHAPKTFRF